MSKSDPTGLDDDECNAGCAYWTSVATGGFSAQMSNAANGNVKFTAQVGGSSTEVSPKTAEDILDRGGHADSDVRASVAAQITVGGMQLASAERGAGYGFGRGAYNVGQDAVEEKEENKGILSDIVNPAAPLYAYQYYQTMSYIQRLDPSFSVLTRQDFTPGADDVKAAESELEAVKDKVANQIGGGHALPKHGSEFGTSSPGGLGSIARTAMSGPGIYLQRGRTAFYDASSNTLVIVDPSRSDFGTIFRPSQGQQYIDNLK